MAQVFTNPTPEELRAWTEEMPEARISEYGNVNVQTKVLSRSAGSTYVVGPRVERQDDDAEPTTTRSPRCRTPTSPSTTWS